MPSPQLQAPSIEFVRLVAALRDAQRSYFKTRSSAVLGECRNLEKRVDAEILAILEPSLFPSDDK